MMMTTSYKIREPEKLCKIQGSYNSPPGNWFQRFFKHLWFFIWDLYIIILDIIDNIFIKAPTIEFESMEKHSDQVAVMTGEPQGIGFDIVKKLLQLDYTVILGIRDESRSQKGIDKIRDLGITTGRVKFLYLDLKSLKSVREFAKNVLASEDGSRIDLLLNNAGIVSECYERTEDHFESTFQVNYLGHFLLTNLLLPRIKETAAKKSGDDRCHIVNTSSCFHRYGTIDFKELETSNVYSSLKCYNVSKLCLIIHAKMLEKKFKEENVNIHAYAVHPGAIVTGIWEDMGGVVKFFLRPIKAIMKLIGRTTNEGANTILYPLLTLGVLDEFGGNYFETGKVIQPPNQANQPEILQRLWDRSMELTTG